MALWVEQNHGQDGPRYIAEQIGRLAFAGDAQGVKMWKEVARRVSGVSHAPERPE